VAEQVRIEYAADQEQAGCRGAALLARRATGARVDPGWLCLIQGALQHRSHSVFRLMTHHALDSLV
jgi:hypothetical protein